MGYAVFHNTTKLLVSWCTYEPAPFDPSTQTKLELATKPDRRANRLADTLDSVRDATVQELADYDAALLDKKACNEYDYQKDLKALALVMLDELNLIRGSSAATIAGMADRTEAQLRTAFIDKRKTL